MLKAIAPSKGEQRAAYVTVAHFKAFDGDGTIIFVPIEGEENQLHDAPGGFTQAIIIICTATLRDSLPPER